MLGKLGKLTKLAKRADSSVASGSKTWSGPILLALNPIAPLNILIAVILSITYMITWKRTLPTLNCDVCPEKNVQRIVLVLLIYLVISIATWKVLCKALPMLPPPVGTFFSTIC